MYGLPHGWQFVTRKSLRVALAMVVLAGWAQEANAQAPPQAFQKLMQPYVDAKMFMGSVLVASRGKIIFNNGYGMADLEWSIPNSPTTRFNIASMTEAVTRFAPVL
jgi:CubicO group peptidase (beta-lactamase class C family)